MPWHEGGIFLKAAPLHLNPIFEYHNLICVALNVLNITQG